MNANNIEVLGKTNDGRIVAAIPLEEYLEGLRTIDRLPKPTPGLTVLLSVGQSSPSEVPGMIKRTPFPPRDGVPGDPPNQAGLRGRQKKQKKTGFTGNCEICGDPFESKMPTTKLCRKLQCKKEYNRIRANDRNAAKKAGQGRSPRRQTSSQTNNKKQTPPNEGKQGRTTRLELIKAAAARVAAKHGGRPVSAIGSGMAAGENIAELDQARREAKED
jgi:hypothetical protein